MAEAPATLEGWYALHDFRRFDWARWKGISSSERSAILREAGAFLAETESVAVGTSAFYSILGHKADFLLLHLRPTVEELNELERAFAKTRLADFTTESYSYLSVTELGQYEASARGGTTDEAAIRQTQFAKRRLTPGIPEGMNYLCFYPMSHRRGEAVNWYVLDMEERRQMMRGHGAIGHKYHNDVIQLVCGSMGLDDWEWGITLFARDPLPVKKLIAEMRFDETSAKFAEFGPFQFGIRFLPGQMGDIFGIR